VPCNYVARWNGSEWRSLGNGVNGSAACVYALTAHEGGLVAGGTFSTAGGAGANNIARWNGSAWQTLGSGTNDSVQAMTVYNGELIAGGYFTTAGGISANYVARWNDSAWQPLGDGTNGAVKALTVYNGELIAGGYFTTAGGGSANYIARWDGFAWQPLGSGMSGESDTAVLALAVHDDDLAAGGRFSTAGGQVSGYWARWTNSPRPVVTQQPMPQAVSIGQTAQFSVAAWGTAPLSYQWRRDGVALADDGNISGATAAMLTVNPSTATDRGDYDVVITNDCGSTSSSSATLAVTAPPGDFDDDGDVDQADFGQFQACMSGNTVPQDAPECDKTHFDADSDVDQSDLDFFLQCLGGPDAIGDVDCAG